MSKYTIEVGIDMKVYVWIGKWDSCHLLSYIVSAASLDDAIEEVCKAREQTNELFVADCVGQTFSSEVTPEFRRWLVDNVEIPDISLSSCAVFLSHFGPDCEPKL